ncbi:MAG TPA: bifunctional indole-3-glycerol-phosphate synthase TrpC/phosphoribosylanthranilate isomerase TrpF [Gemmatimonadales bacterium]|nr:bifunctional indole-3-glycerol-phosphate synthase TrpC/phosphoribosylanthranilate isomerase TrpF [Gemmatimonadales bacterium]
MNHLAELQARKHQEVAQRRARLPLTELQRSVEPTTRRFGAALRRPGLRFIFECKQSSPSEGLLRTHYDPAQLARGYSDIADAISVLTDEPWFRGSLTHLAEVRRATTAPVLCKDFIVDPYQVFEARMHGADAILLILALINDADYLLCAAHAESLGMDVLTEVHDETELRRALKLEAPIIGINNRNLDTLAVDRSTTLRLAPMIPRDRVIVCESGIRSRSDIDAAAGLVDAFLVGSRLMRQPRPDLAAREVAFGKVKICGLTSPADADAAYGAGAALGGVILSPSPRQVDEVTAHAVAEGPLPLVGVFVNETQERVAELAVRIGLAAVQLHGDETPSYVADLRRRLPGGTEIWKAVRVNGSIPLPDQFGADRLLLDSTLPGRRGGTGTRFDWSRLKGYPALDRIVLAGGLDPHNIGAAHQLGCGALDVCSGVESSPGRKDPMRLDALFAGLRGAA